MKTDSLMRKLILVIAAISWIWSSAYAKDHDDACKGAATRAVQFLKNAHTGKTMVADEWLTDEARQSKVFSGFGGVDALVTQSTNRAVKFGGLKSVKILSAKRVDNGCQVSAEVKFKKNHRDATNPAVAANEEMIWTFQMIELNGSWKIAG